jgi:hypothetical protein
MLLIKIMKDKQFDPARNNDQAPAEGMAAVKTHMPEEETIEKASTEQEEGEQRTEPKGGEERPSGAQ